MTDNPIDTVLAAPAATTLDECLRRAPSLLKREDLASMVTVLRAERVSFLVKAEQRDAKREGVEEIEANGGAEPSEVLED